MAVATIMEALKNRTNYETNAFSTVRPNRSAGRSVLLLHPRPGADRIIASAIDSGGIASPIGCWSDLPFDLTGRLASRAINEYKAAIWAMRFKADPSAHHPIQRPHYRPGADEKMIAAIDEAVACARANPPATGYWQYLEPETVSGLIAEELAAYKAALQPAPRPDPTLHGRIRTRYFHSKLDKLVGEIDEQGGRMPPDWLSKAWEEHLRNIEGTARHCQEMNRVILEESEPLHPAEMGPGKPGFRRTAEDLVDVREIERILSNS